MGSIRKNDSKLKKKLSQSEKKFQLLFDLAPDMMYLLDSKGRILDANKISLKAIGVKKKDVMGKSLFKLGLLSKIELKKALTDFAKNLKGKKTGPSEFTALTKTGKNIFVEVMSYPFIFNGERVVLSIARDISGRKKVEQELRESKIRFSSIADNIPGVVYRCKNDKDWTMDYISDTIKELSGYPASDFRNNDVRSYASIIHPNDRAIVNKAVQEGVKKKKPYGIYYRVIHKDKSIKWVYEKGIGVFYHGKFRYFDGVIFDITDKKKSEEELQNKVEELEKFTNVFVGRELKMVELKKKIKELEAQLRQRGRNK